MIVDALSNILNLLDHNCKLFFLVFVLGSGSFSFIVVIILKNTIFFPEIEKAIGLNVTILRKRNNFAA